jgi:hypothetical protein
MRHFFVTAIILRLVSLFSRQDQALTGAQTPLHGEALNMASETSIFPAVGVTLYGSAIRSSRVNISRPSHGPRLQFQQFVVVFGCTLLRNGQWLGCLVAPLAVASAVQGYMLETQREPLEVTRATHRPRGAARGVGFKMQFFAAEKSPGYFLVS